MSVSERVTRYCCDECGKEEVTSGVFFAGSVIDKPPDGWHEYQDEHYCSDECWDNFINEDESEE